MKTRLLLLVAICFCSLNSTNAQTNLGFETWGNDSLGANNPLDWTTLNYDIEFSSPVSTFQETTDPGELLSSAKMVTTAGYAASLGAFGFPDVCGGFVQQIAPYTLLATSIDFVYKSNIAVGDTGLILSQLSHWNGDSTVVDGYAFMQFTSPAVTNWTPVSLPYTYLTSDTVYPDTVTILAISSQELILGLPLAVAGSELQLDAIVLNTITGLREVEVDNWLNIYPNPAAGFINIEIDGADRAMLYVFDFAGRQVKEIAINQMLTQINTADLNNGIYFYQSVGDSGEKLGSGKFVISK